MPEVFPSSFFIFIVFTYPAWRWDPDGIMLNNTVLVRPAGPVGGFFRIRDNRGAELKYFSNRVGK